jgi:hypothetical protein
MRRGVLLAVAIALVASNARAQEIQLTGPLRGASATCPREPRRGRFELAATSGLLERGGRVTAGARLQWFLADAVGFGASAMTMFDPRADDRWIGLAHVTFVPMDGKVRMFGEAFTRVWMFVRGDFGWARIDRTTFVSGAGAGVALEAASWLSFELAHDVLVPAVVRGGDAWSGAIPMTSIAASVWWPRASSRCGEDDDVVIASRGRACARR